MSLERLRGYLLLCVCLLGAPACAEDAAIPPDNLVANGRFTEVGAGGAPEAWALARDAATVDATLSLDAGPEGQRAARIDCTRMERTTVSSHAMLAQVGRVRVEKGRWYRLSFQAKARGIASRGVGLSLVDTNGWENCGLEARARLGRDWRRCEFLFQATRDVGPTGRLQIWHTDTGTFWVADVVLVPSQPQERRYHPALPPAPGRNLVPNASFEAGAGGWGSTSRLNVWGSRGLGFRFGEVDRAVAFDGRASFKIAVTPANTPEFHFDYYRAMQQRVRDFLVGNEGWIRVEPGKPYTLSAVMKADRPGVIARMGLCARGVTPSEQVTLGTGWQRHSVRLIPTQPWVFVGLGPDLDASKLDTATVWIDAVQLEAGEQPTPFVPYAPVEAGFETGQTGNLFTAGKPATVRATLCNQGSRAETATLAWRATDFFDRPAGEGKRVLTLPPGGRREEVLDTGLRGPGFYRLRFTLESGGRTFARELRVASIVPVPAGESHFGMNHAPGWPQLLDLCDRAGLRWMRDWSIKWDHVQPKPGPFDFSLTDAQIDRVVERKLPLLALLPFPSAEWSAGEAPGQPARGYDELGRTTLMPKDLQAFSDYVAAAVAHYKGKVRHWEILNEPYYTGYSLPRGRGYQVEDYVRLLSAAYRAAKAADPGCTVIGGIGAPPETLTRELCAAGGLRHLDALNLHIYPGATPPEAYEPQLANLRRFMREAGRGDLPLWLTEYAYYADDDPPVTPSGDWMTPVEGERECGEYLVKWAAVMLGHGVEKVFYHSGTCSALNLEITEAIFFEYGGAPRKMLPAQAALARMLPGSRRILKIADLHPEARGYLFGDARGKVMILWARGDEPLSLRLTDRRLAAFDVMGAPIAGRQIALTESPVYLTAPANLPAAAFVAGVHVGK